MALMGNLFATVMTILFGTMLVIVLMVSYKIADDLFTKDRHIFATVVGVQQELLVDKTHPRSMFEQQGVGRNIRNTLYLEVDGQIDDITVFLDFYRTTNVGDQFLVKFYNGRFSKKLHITDIYK